MSSPVLNSWKEIATYVGRGVRTVQRWEQDLDFPVRRPRGKQRSAVIALKSDVDLWLRRPHVTTSDQSKRLAHQQSHSRLVENTQRLLLRTSTLVAQSDVLRKQIARAINIGMVLRSSCAAGRADRKNWAATTAAIKPEIDRAMDLGAALQSSRGGGGRPEIGRST